MGGDTRNHYQKEKNERACLPEVGVEAADSVSIVGSQERNGSVHHQKASAQLARDRAVRKTWQNDGCGGVRFERSCGGTVA